MRSPEVAATSFQPWAASCWICSCTGGPSSQSSSSWPLWKRGRQPRWYWKYTSRYSNSCVGRGCREGGLFAREFKIGGCAARACCRADGCIARGGLHLCRRQLITTQDSARISGVSLRLVIGQDPFCQRLVVMRSRRLRSIFEDSLPVAGRFGQAHAVADGRAGPLGIMALQQRQDFGGFFHPPVEEGWQDIAQRQLTAVALEIDFRLRRNSSRLCRDITSSETGATTSTA